MFPNWAILITNPSIAIATAIVASTLSSQEIHTSQSFHETEWTSQSPDLDPLENPSSLTELFCKEECATIFSLNFRLNANKHHAFLENYYYFHFSIVFYCVHWIPSTWKFVVVKWQKCEEVLGLRILLQHTVAVDWEMTHHKRFEHFRHYRIWREESRQWGEGSHGMLELISFSV